jgi:hypothetical protein
MKAQKSTEIDKHDVLDLEVGNSSSPRKLWGVGQQSCPPSGQPGAVQYSVISMEAADKSCQVADGSFVKEARSYTVHFSAAVTGSCGTNVYECDALPVSCSCRPDALYIRMIQQTWLYDPLANPFWAFGAECANGRHKNCNGHQQYRCPLVNDVSGRTLDNVAIGVVPDAV